MRHIIFRRNKGVGYQPTEETVEIDDDTTEEEIRELYLDWVWEEVADEFTWYEKE